jgi:flagellin
MAYNSKKVDALNDGLGALVDADLAKESANLQALQTRQQLGVQTLSLANQGSQTLLSLFR